MLISVTGMPTDKCKWFAINLQTGKNVNPRDDIALHINPRFDDRPKVVRNALLVGG
jgi:hypothetical protein